MGSPPMNSTTRVTFIVQDVNDNKPEFYGSPYNASVIFDESLQNVSTLLNFNSLIVSKYECKHVYNIC